MQKPALLIAHSTHNLRPWIHDLLNSIITNMFREGFFNTHVETNLECQHIALFHSVLGINTFSFRSDFGSEFRRESHVSVSSK